MSPGEAIVQALADAGYELRRRRGGLQWLRDPGVVTLEHPLEDPEALARPAVVPLPEGQPMVRYVAVIELGAAAGGGAVDLDNEPVKTYAAFRRRWLERRNLDPNRCSVIGVRGESMEPVLPDGCSVLVNRAEAARRRRAGGIFVLQTGDGLVVKRLEKSDGRWVLVSEHQAWADQPWDVDTKIIGEVRWMATAF